VKVYLATEGEYSDYSVVAAFKDQPTAERFAGWLPDGEVLEMQLLTRDPRKVVRHGAGVERFWDREAGRWGAWSEIRTWSYDLWDFEAVDDAPQVIERENFIRASGCASAEQAISLVAARQEVSA
jgi:hypothetical protein